MTLRFKILIIAILLCAIFWVGLYKLGIALHATGTIVSAVGLFMAPALIAVVALSTFAYLFVLVFEPTKPALQMLYTPPSAE